MKKYIVCIFVSFFYITTTNAQINQSVIKQPVIKPGLNQPVTNSGLKVQTAIPKVNVFSKDLLTTNLWVYSFRYTDGAVDTIILRFENSGVIWAYRKSGNLTTNFYGTYHLEQNQIITDTLKMSENICKRMVLNLGGNLFTLNGKMFLGSVNCGSMWNTAPATSASSQWNSFDTVFKKK